MGKFYPSTGSHEAPARTVRAACLYNHQIMLKPGNILDVLTALRAATAERHTQLDTRTPLAAEVPDLRAYRDHLYLLAAWLAPLQPALMTQVQAQAQPGLPPRDYLSLIRADLAHPALAGLPPLPALQPAPLAQFAQSAQLAQFAQLDDAAQLDAAAFLWGVAYVVEGSQLGGAVLYKRLAEQLAPHPLAYLRGAGSPGPRWQQFLAALRAAVVTERQIEQACRGARQAFDSLIGLVDDLSRSSAPVAGQP